MGPPLEILIVADDLTGAADTAVQFCPVLGPVLLVGPGAIAGALAEIDAAAIARFTHSRHLKPAAAARQVEAALQGLAPQQVYKKIDSCLRGNPGVEIEALMGASGATASFVAPALPSQGRTTINDIHQVDGVPLAESEIGRDPLCPLAESCLSANLAGQCRLPVGHIDLTCIDSGTDAMARKVQRLLNDGCRHIAFDALHGRHLDTIVALAQERFPHILLAGSAGLAASLARYMGRTMARTPAHLEQAARPNITSWLWVCGSASSVLAQQAAALARATGWPRRMLDPLALSAPQEISSSEDWIMEQAQPWSAEGLILGIQPKPAQGAAADPDRVVQGLAKLAIILLAKGKPQGIFLSGGDTAQAVWQQAGASALKVEEEILPGLVLGRFWGGAFSGLPVVTKAGAFGETDSLIELVKLLT
ncbi:MAG: four-carbon acid sugar kinase family protein [Desulfobacterales bacterium]